VALRTIGLERAPLLAGAAATRCTHGLAADAMQLPFATGSIDIVTMSQVLHHFDGAEAEHLLQECTRVARVAVIVGDLRRSWLAVAGLWVSSFALGFHPVSRHDGVLSVLRGYTRDELRALVERATRCPATVRHRLGFRVTAHWSPQYHAP
jgi:ubiquinone/menaquinone biosynthesis C-methylase UbiE